MSEETTPGVRIGAYLASAGVCSRRDAAKMLEEARVKVNGKVIRDLSFKVIEGEHEVTFNNRAVKPLAKETFLYNKPKGVVCHPETTGTLRSWMEDLPQYKHLNPAGRLDAMSEGLVILTNDGDLHNRLTHPRYKLPKLYRVWLRGRVDDYALRYLTSGAIMLDGVRVQPCRIEIATQSAKETQTYWTLYEGKNRQIRRMAEAAKLTVTKLVREKVGPLTLREVPTGGIRPITAKELQQLEKAFEQAKTAAESGVRPHEQKPFFTKHEATQKTPRGRTTSRKSPSTQGDGGRKGNTKRGPGAPTRGARRPR